MQSKKTTKSAISLEPRTLKLEASQGFSLIELVVVMAIFITVSSVVFVSQGRFGGNTMITNLAYDVALTMRQAQVYGISVRKVKAVSDPEGIAQFDRSYGIHFDSNKGYYILFADADNDKKYNLASNSDTGCLSSPSSGLPECVSFFKIEQGNYIKQFCGGVDCYGSLTNGRIDRLEILFHRPEPEPTIWGYKGGSPVNTNSYVSASVLVSSPQGATKSVCISATGQMSIKNSC